MIHVTRMVEQSEGKILLQGLAFLNSEEFPEPVLLIARFQEGGEVDLTFGNQGLMRHDLPADRYKFLAYLSGDLHVLPNGKILACNTSVTYEDHESKEALERALIYRLTSAGELDTSFNGTGFLELGVPLSTPNASLRVTRLYAQPNGKIILVGQLTAVEDRYSRGFIARLDNRGQVDNTFGPVGNGFFEFSLDGYSVEVNAVASNSRGSIVWGGIASALEVPDLGLQDQGFIIALTADGVLESGFNGGNLMITQISEEYTVQWVSARFQPDEKLLVTGRSRSERFDSYLYIARYNVDGTADVLFGDQGNGRVDIPTGGNTNLPIGMQLQMDKRIVAGLNGTSLNKGILWRLLNDQDE